MRMIFRRHLGGLGLGRDLGLLLGGQFVAIAGARVFDIVLVWYALDEAPSWGAVGGLIFLRYLPYALFGLVCGWLSDRMDRRRLIVAADLFRGALLAATALALVLGAAPLAVLAGTAFLLTAARTLFQPAVQGLMPLLAGEESLVRGNALFHGGSELLGIVAPVVGGALLAVLPMPAILVAVSASFTIAAVMALSIGAVPEIERGGPEAVSGEPAGRPLAGLLADYRALWQLLRGSRRDVLGALAMNSVSILGVAGILSLLIPILIKDALGAGPAMLGLVWSVMAAGTAAGAALSLRVTAATQMRAMLVAWLTYGVLIGALALPQSLGPVLAIAALMGATGAIADILFATIVQARMPAAHVSKTFAAFSTLANCGEAVSAPVLAFAAGAFGLGGAIALGAALPVLAAGLCLGAPLVQRPVPLEVR